MSTTDTAAPLTPFRGVEEFRYVDRLIFPGRVEEVRRLLRLVTLYRGVLLYGESGVGKSSLINAGLIPEAIADGFAPERIRVDPRPGAEIIVERVSLSEGDDAPFLPSRFAKNESSRRITLSIEEFKRNVDSLIGTRPPPGKYPLLIFDQFEELLTLGEQVRSKRRPWSKASQDEIVSVLLNVLADERVPVKIIFAFREDFLARLTKVFMLHPNLNDHFLRLDPLTIENFVEIVSTPFRKAEFPRPLSAELIAELEYQFRTRGDTSLLNLSEVQIAALRLWESDDPKTLLAQRGVGGLIEDYFKNSIERLGNLQPLAIMLLNRMVTFSDTRNVVTRDDLLHDVSKDERIPKRKVGSALDALEKRRVVRGEKRNNVIVYEIVSEYLVPWIVRKRAEIAAEKKRIETIEQASREYIAAVEKRAEERWRRIVRINIALVSVTAVILVAALVWNWRRNLQDELRMAKRHIATLQGTIDARETTIEDLQRQINELRKTEQSFKTANGVLANALSLVRSRAEAVEKRENDLREQLERLTRDVTRLREQLRQEATRTTPGEP